MNSTKLKFDWLPYVVSGTVIVCTVFAVYLAVWVTMLLVTT